MIELKQVYAGRARHIYPIVGDLNVRLHQTLNWAEQALPEDLILRTLTAWELKPFVSTSPLQLQVEPLGEEIETYDVFLWVYVRDHCVYPTLEAAKAESSEGWRGL